MKRTFFAALVSAAFVLGTLAPVSAAPASARTELITLELDAAQTRLERFALAPLQTRTLPEISFSAQAAPSHGSTIFGLPLNMGPIDRILRGVIAAGLIGTGIYGLSSGNIAAPVSWTLIGVSAIPIATGASGYCPLYQLFGLDYSF